MLESKGPERLTTKPGMTSIMVWHNPQYRQWVRVIAIFVMLTFVLPYLTWAFDSATFPSSLPSVLFNHQKVLIPEKLGTVNHLYQGDNRLVVHIQDLHCNYEVQMNIARIIHLLAEKHGLHLVSVEGTALPINTTKIRTFPIKKIRTEVSDYFVRKGKLSGAEYYAAVGEHPVLLEGIESADLYARNKRSVEFILKDEGQGYCYDLRDRLDALKSVLYNRRLLKFDNQCMLYRDGKTNVLTQTLFLLKIARQLGHDPGIYPNAVMYAKHRREFFTPQIDADALFKELEILEYNLRDYFYTGTGQRALDRHLRHLVIIEKLMSISGSPEDLGVFRQNRADFQVQRFADFIRAHDKTGELEMEPEIFMLDGFLNAVVDFYQVADERSTAFVQNTLQRMQKHNEKLVVLVTGGFHTEHVLAGLKAQGMSVLSLKPGLTHQDLVNPYFTLLRNRKTPLEKLLSQEQRIFTLEPFLPKVADPHRMVNSGELPERERLFSKLLELFFVTKTVAHNFMQTKVVQEIEQRVEKTLGDYQAWEGLVKVDALAVRSHPNQALSFPVTASGQRDMLAVVWPGKQRLGIDERAILENAAFSEEHIAMIRSENRGEMQAKLDAMPSRALADLKLRELVPLYLGQRGFGSVGTYVYKLFRYLGEARFQERAGRVLRKLVGLQFSTGDLRKLGRRLRLSENLRNAALLTLLFYWAPLGLTPRDLFVTYPGMVTLSLVFFVLRGGDKIYVKTYANRLQAVYDLMGSLPGIRSLLEKGVMINDIGPGWPMVTTGELTAFAKTLNPANRIIVAEKPGRVPAYVLREKTRGRFSLFTRDGKLLDVFGDGGAVVRKSLVTRWNVNRIFNGIHKQGKNYFGYGLEKVPLEAELEKAGFDLQEADLGHGIKADIKTCFNTLYMYKGRTAEVLHRMGDDLEEGGYLLAGHSVSRAGQATYIQVYRKKTGMLVPVLGALFTGKNWHHFSMDAFSLQQSARMLEKFYDYSDRHMTFDTDELLIDLRASAGQIFLKITGANDAEDAFNRVPESGEKLSTRSAEDSPDISVTQAGHTIANAKLSREIMKGNVFTVDQENLIHPVSYEDRGKRKNVRPVLGKLSDAEIKTVQLRIAQTVPVKIDAIRHPGGALDKVIRKFAVRDIAPVLGLSVTETKKRLMEIARTVDILLVQGRFTLYEKGPFAHTRRGQAEPEPGIWLGERIFEIATEKEIAQVLLEEAKHILAPELEHHIIKHSEKLVAKLRNHAKTIQEKTEAFLCQQIPSGKRAEFEDLVYQRDAAGRLYLEAILSGRYGKTAVVDYPDAIVKKVVLNKRQGLTHGGIPVWDKLTELKHLAGRFPTLKKFTEVTVEYHQGKIIRAWAGDPYPGDDLNAPDRNVPLVYFASPFDGQGWAIAGRNVMYVVHNNERLPVKIAGQFLEKPLAKLPALLKELGLSYHPGILVKHGRTNGAGIFTHNKKPVFSRKKYGHHPVCIEFAGKEIVRIWLGDPYPNDYDKDEKNPSAKLLWFRSPGDAEDWGIDGENVVYVEEHGEYIVQEIVGPDYLKSKIQDYKNALVKKVNPTHEGGLTHGGITYWYTHMGLTQEDELTLEYENGDLVRVWLGDPYLDRDPDNPDRDVPLIWFKESRHTQGWKIKGRNIVCQEDQGRLKPMEIVGTNYTRKSIEKYPQCFVASVYTDKNGFINHYGGNIQLGEAYGNRDDFIVEYAMVDGKTTIVKVWAENRDQDREVIQLPDTASLIYKLETVKGQKKVWKKRPDHKRVGRAERTRRLGFTIQQNRVLDAIEALGGRATIEEIAATIRQANYVVVSVMNQLDFVSVNKQRMQQNRLPLYPVLDTQTKRLQDEIIAAMEMLGGIATQQEIVDYSGQHRRQINKILGDVDFELVNRIREKQGLFPLQVIDYRTISYKFFGIKGSGSHFIREDIIGGLEKLYGKRYTGLFQKTLVPWLQYITKTFVPLSDDMFNTINREDLLMILSGIVQTRFAALLDQKNAQGAIKGLEDERMVFQRYWGSIVPKAFNITRSVFSELKLDSENYLDWEGAGIEEVFSANLERVIRQMELDRIVSIAPVSIEFNAKQRFARAALRYNDLRKQSDAQPSEMGGLMPWLRDYMMKRWHWTGERYRKWAWAIEAVPMGVAGLAAVSIALWTGFLDPAIGLSALATAAVRFSWGLFPVMHLAKDGSFTWQGLNQAEKKNVGFSIALAVVNMAVSFTAVPLWGLIAFGLLSHFIANFLMKSFPWEIEFQNPLKMMRIVTPQGYFGIPVPLWQSPVLMMQKNDGQDTLVSKAASLVGSLIRRNRIYLLDESSNTYFAVKETGKDYSKDTVVQYPDCIVKNVYLNSLGGLTHGKKILWQRNARYKNRKDITVEYRDGKVIRAWAGDPYSTDFKSHPDVDVPMIYVTATEYIGDWKLEGEKIMFAVKDGKMNFLKIVGKKFTKDMKNAHERIILKNVHAGKELDLAKEPRYIGLAYNGRDDLCVEYEKGRLVRVWDGDPYAKHDIDNPDKSVPLIWFAEPVYAEGWRIKGRNSFYVEKNGKLESVAIAGKFSKEAAVDYPDAIVKEVRVSEFDGQLLLGDTKKQNIYLPELKGAADLVAEYQNGEIVCVWNGDPFTATDLTVDRAIPLVWFKETHHAAGWTLLGRNVLYTLEKGKYLPRKIVGKYFAQHTKNKYNCGFLKNVRSTKDGIEIGSKSVRKIPGKFKNRDNLVVEYDGDTILRVWADQPFIHDEINRPDPNARLIYFARPGLAHGWRLEGRNIIYLKAGKQLLPQEIIGRDYTEKTIDKYPDCIVKSVMTGEGGSLDHFGPVWSATQYRALIDEITLEYKKGEIVQAWDGDPFPENDLNRLSEWAQPIELSQGKRVKVAPLSKAALAVNRILKRLRDNRYGGYIRVLAHRMNFEDAVFLADHLLDENNMGFALVLINRAMPKEEKKIIQEMLGTLHPSFTPFDEQGRELSNRHEIQTFHNKMRHIDSRIQMVLVDLFLRDALSIGKIIDIEDRILQDVRSRGNAPACLKAYFVLRREAEQSGQTIADSVVFNKLYGQGFDSDTVRRVMGRQNRNVEKPSEVLTALEEKKSTAVIREAERDIGQLLNVFEAVGILDPRAAEKGIRKIPQLERAEVVYVLLDMLKQQYKVFDEIDVWKLSNRITVADIVTVFRQVRMETVKIDAGIVSNKDEISEMVTRLAVAAGLLSEEKQVRQDDAKRFDDFGGQMPWLRDYMMKRWHWTGEQYQRRAWFVEAVPMSVAGLAAASIAMWTGFLDPTMIAVWFAWGLFPIMHLFKDGRFAWQGLTRTEKINARISLLLAAGNVAFSLTGIPLLGMIAFGLVTHFVVDFILKKARWQQVGKITAVIISGLLFAGRSVGGFFQAIGNVLRPGLSSRSGDADAAAIKTWEVDTEVLASDPVAYYARLIETAPTDTIRNYLLWGAEAGNLQAFLIGLKPALLVSVDTSILSAMQKHGLFGPGVQSVEHSGFGIFLYTASAVVRRIEQNSDLYQNWLPETGMTGDAIRSVIPAMIPRMLRLNNRQSDWRHPAQLGVLLGFPREEAERYAQRDDLADFIYNSLLDKKLTPEERKLIQLFYQPILDYRRIHMRGSVGKSSRARHKQLRPRVGSLIDKYMPMLSGARKNAFLNLQATTVMGAFYMTSETGAGDVFRKQVAEAFRHSGMAERVQQLKAEHTYQLTRSRQEILQQMKFELRRAHAAKQELRAIDLFGRLLKTKKQDQRVLAKLILRIIAKYEMWLARGSFDPQANEAAIAQFVELDVTETVENSDRQDAKLPTVGEKKPDVVVAGVETKITSRNLETQWQVLAKEDFPRDDQGVYRAFTRAELAGKIQIRAEALLNNLTGWPQRDFGEFTEKIMQALWPGDDILASITSEWQLLPIESKSNEIHRSVGDLEKVGRALPYFNFFAEADVAWEKDADGKHHLTGRLRAPGARRIYLARAAGSHYEAAHYQQQLSGDQADQMDARIFTISRDALGVEWFGWLQHVTSTHAEQSRTYAEYEEKLLAFFEQEHQSNPSFRKMTEILRKQIKASGILNDTQEFLVIDEVDIGTYQLLFKYIVEKYQPESKVTIFVGDSWVGDQYKNEFYNTQPVFAYRNILISDYPDVKLHILEEVFGMSPETAWKHFNAMGNISADLPQPVKIEPTTANDASPEFQPESPQVLLGSYLRSLLIYNGVVEFNRLAPGELAKAEIAWEPAQKGEPLTGPITREMLPPDAMSNRSLTGTRPGWLRFYQLLMRPGFRMRSPMTFFINGLAFILQGVGVLAIAIRGGTTDADTRRTRKLSLAEKQAVLGDALNARSFDAGRIRVRPLSETKRSFMQHVVKGSLLGDFEISDQGTLHIFLPDAVYHQSGNPIAAQMARMMLWTQTMRYHAAMDAVNTRIGRELAQSTLSHAILDPNALTSVKKDAIQFARNANRRHAGQLADTMLFMLAGKFSGINAMSAGPGKQAAQQELETMLVTFNEIIRQLPASMRHAVSVEKGVLDNAGRTLWIPNRMSRRQFGLYMDILNYLGLGIDRRELDRKWQRPRRATQSAA